MAPTLFQQRYKGVAHMSTLLSPSPHDRCQWSIVVFYSAQRVSGSFSTACSRQTLSIHQSFCARLNHPSSLWFWLLQKSAIFPLIVSASYSLFQQYQPTWGSLERSTTLPGDVRKLLLPGISQGRGLWPEGDAPRKWLSWWQETPILLSSVEEAFFPHFREAWRGEAKWVSWPAGCL